MRRLASSMVSLAAIAHVAHADPIAEPTWRVDIGQQTRWLGDRSAAAVTTESLGMFVLAGERHLASFELPRELSIELAAYGTFADGSASGRMFQTLDTTVDSLELVAGVHATTRLYRIAMVSARAGIGVDDVGLSIAPSGSAMRSVDDGGWGRLATAALGAEVEPLRTPQVSIGIGAEVGYVATSAVEMHAYPGDRGNPDVSIQTAFSSVGHLDLDGWSMRITGHVSF